MEQGRAWKAVVAAALLGFAAGALTLPQLSEADLGEKALVKLYDDGKVIGQWTASNLGRMDEGSFVFTVKEGVRDLRVRIHGTFSVEETD
jgi:hypothetical protein